MLKWLFEIPSAMLKNLDKPKNAYKFSDRIIINLKRDKKKLTKKYSSSNTTQIIYNCLVNMSFKNIFNCTNEKRIEVNPILCLYNWVIFCAKCHFWFPPVDQQDVTEKKM